MKKTFSILAMLMICASLYAQLAKNTIMLGGAASVSSSSIDYNNPLNNSYKVSSFSFEPSAGLFISDKSVIGLRVVAGKQKTESEYDTDSDVNEENFFSGGLFFRRYFTLSEKAAFFMNASASIGRTKSFSIDGSSGDTNTSTTETISATINPGFNYFISKKWAVEGRVGSIYYSKSKSSSDDNNPFNFQVRESDGFGLNFSLSNFYFGLQYFISR